MTKRLVCTSFMLTALASAPAAMAQAFNILDFDPTSGGAWSDRSLTTLVVPKVANGSIKLDGAPTAAEYGGFAGVNVTPGVNAWILDFPGDRIWDGAADSSFTYYLAHDDNYFYIGVEAKDDVINSDNPNAAFWNDDAIEIVVDALNDRLDNNTDSSKDAYGGHNYVNFEGRFSAWNDETNEKTGAAWASAVEFKYGANDDIFGSGKAVTGGWQMEVRFHKRQFEDPAAGNKLRNGYMMGFNIGMDDDDKKGQGVNGDKSRTQDLELQYFWANRQRIKGYTAEYLAGLSPEDKAAQVWRADTENFPLTIDSTGRLSHGGTGEIIFGYDADKKASGKILFLTSNSASPANADPALIGLLRAKGYTVTVQQSGIPAEELQAAALAHDVVLISETIGSGTVLNPAAEPDVSPVQTFMLAETDRPIISFEAYMYDNANWVKQPGDNSNDFTNWGNTSRSEAPEVLWGARDSLYIRNASHPIAAGFAAGKLAVYNTPYSLNYAVTTPDADVIASVQPDGSYPTLFVYEKGDKLWDGSAVPNKRIGLFLGQNANPEANWALEFRELTEAGKTLFLNTIAYAIGSSATPSEPKLSVARTATGITLTYSGGTLQSASSITGPWANEAGASPLSVPTTGAPKFFRVRGN